ncbi:hypothetical protein GCM10011348_33260 [Marinobacterium nitratireducens]|uniref:Uncharacterized protein n=1 Tax=Marinobacterium nitratireducens TaxID=518897 RepID=A0A917ZK03_9GAMM|nr:hypothetical protein GCM10011348_33260 [Marinobacterium nitratireducens]
MRPGGRGIELGVVLEDGPERVYMVPGRVQAEVLQRFGILVPDYLRRQLDFGVGA